MSSLPYYLCYILPVAFFASLYYGGWSHIWVPALGFIIFPIADFFFGRDERNPTSNEEESLKNKFSFQLVTLLWVPTQYLIVLGGAYYAMTNNLTIWQWAGLVFSGGVVSGGIGITIAHELCHRKSRHEQWASQAILLCLNYMHFHIEHVVGHHQRVSTPEDPASAFKGQSFYSFLPQTLVGSYKSAWEFESRRVKVRKLPLWKNRMIVYLLAQTAFSILLFAVFGFKGLLFQLLQSAVGFTFLEIVNYIEHYGLSRNRLANGRYEKVQPIHSWNANHRVSNLLLFKLQRHSDHHANAHRRYQMLRDYPEAPQLPVGYPSLVLLALVPPLWRAVMDKRVDQHYQELESA